MPDGEGERSDAIQDRKRKKKKRGPGEEGKLQCHAFRALDGRNRIRDRYTPYIAGWIDRYMRDDIER